MTTNEADPGHWNRSSSGTRRPESTGHHLPPCMLLLTTLLWAVISVAAGVWLPRADFWRAVRRFGAAVAGLLTF